MWDTDNRSRYDRSKLRYPSDLTDDEWAIIAPLIPPAKRGGNKRTVNVRDIVNGLMYILSTGCQWAALPKDLPPRSTVNRYFMRWDHDHTLDRLHHALYVQCREQAGREASPTAGIIDNLQRLSIAFGNGTFASSARASRARKKGGLGPTWLRCRQEDQGQEAASPRQYAGLADASHRPLRRYTRPRWQSADGRVLLMSSLFGLFPCLLKLCAGAARIRQAG